MTICRYINKDQFEEIAHFLSEEKFLLASDCVEQSKDDSNTVRLVASLGGDDFEEEGTFRTVKNSTLIEHLPWAAGRPSIGVDYGCLTLMMMFKMKDDQHSYLESAEIWDEVCYRAPGYCTLCSVDRPVIEMRVRGLCTESIYDDKYFYNIAEDGKMMFLGEEESMIKFDDQKNAWIWSDRNYPESLGKCIDCFI